MATSQREKRGECFLPFVSGNGTAKGANDF
jgi:hypothetical protein